jgi:transcriptional regulator with XRE-family HTH domain
VCCNGYMHNQPPPQAFGPTINRVSDLMEHTTKYSFWGVSQLAADAKVTPSAISRLINGKMNPSFAMVARVTTALERELGFRIDPRDLVAENGEFLTRYACDFAACRGCYPTRATDEFGDMKSAFAGIEKGHWVTSRYPRGFEATLKGGL